MTIYATPPGANLTEEERRRRHIHSMLVMGIAPPATSTVPTGPQPIFFAPLTSSLVPTIAGNPTATFTRATTAYATGVAPTGNAVDGQVLILCNANEPRFHGARRISANNWSETYADASPIPAATLLGYVAENAATNLSPQSQTFDNAGWGKIGCVIAADQIAAPDGTITADRFTDDTTTATHRVFESFGSITNGQIYAYSVYLKQGTLPWAQVNFYDGVGNGQFANFNLATGAVGNKSAGVTAATQTLPNGWYRCSITFTAAGATQQPQVFGILTDQNVAGPSYVGTGQTMYLWGAQVETGSAPTSYIPTTTVAVVRNGDVLSYQTATNIDGALATTYTEAVPTVSTATHQVILGWTGPFYPQFYSSPTRPFGIYSTAATLTTANLRVLNAINKQATAWSGATASLVLNGGTVATGAFTAYAVGVIGIGQQTLIAFGGTIRNVKFYNVRIADADLRTMTT